MSSTAPAESPISTVASAMAVAKLAAPGCPSSRKMATGMVDRVRTRDEERRPELAQRDGEGEAGAHQRGSPQDRRVHLAPGTRRRGTQDRRRLPQAIVDGTDDRHHGAHHEGQRDERVGDGDEQDGGAQVDGRRVQRDQEAEADDDRRGAEGQHDERVHRPREPAAPVAHDGRRQQAQAAGQERGGDREEERVARRRRWVPRPGACAGPPGARPRTPPGRSHPGRRGRAPPGPGAASA